MKKLILAIVLLSCRTTKLPCPEVGIDKKGFIEISTTSWKLGYASGVDNALHAVVDSSVNLICLGNQSFEEFYFVTDSVLNAK